MAGVKWCHIEKFLCSLHETANETLKACAMKGIKEAYSSIKGYKENLKQLQDAHQTLSRKKEDVDDAVRVPGQRITNEAEGWLENVRKLIEADHKLKQLLDEDYRKGRDQCCFRLCNCNLYRRYEMSRLAKAKAEEIHERITQQPSHLTRPVQIPDLEPPPTEHFKGLESRERLRDQILGTLKDVNVFAVGICGMGGTGKSTLAVEIKNRANRHLFDAVVMVEVSDAPNIERIQDHIAAGIGYSSLDSRYSIDQRATMLFSALKQVKSAKERRDDKGTKILIILDNISAKLDLQKVGIPQERTRDFCCKILLTTRDQNVCIIMGVPYYNIFYVNPLIVDEARDLFRARVGDIISDQVLEDRLLNKCGNLPLAITVLADALRGQELSHWEHVALELEKPISKQVEGVHDRTYSILGISYKLINSKEKKMFFLLACLFPPGSSIHIEQLMRYGIGLGLFPYDSLIEAMEQASKWAKELISSSLLLRDYFQFSMWQKYDSKRVRIHDLVRASVISFAKTDGNNFMVEAIPRLLPEESFKECTAISLMSGTDHVRLDGCSCSMLETLMLNGSQPSDKFENTFFQGMPKLKVLALSGMQIEPTIPNSIIKPANLTTLCLEGCKLGDIGLIGKMVNLVVLSLCRSDVKKLPHEFKNLRKLSLLDLSECKKLEVIPAYVIGSLCQLEILYMLDSFEKWQNIEAKLDDGERAERGASLAELMPLSKLNILEVHVPKIQQLPADDRLAKNLSNFIISVGSSSYVSHLTLPYSSVLEVINTDLRPLLENSFLKALLRKAEFLNLEAINSLKDLAPKLNEEGFRGLKALRIGYCNDMDCFFRTNNMINYHKHFVLEVLSFHHVSNLEMICDSQTPRRLFSNLRGLDLIDVPKLESILGDAKSFTSTNGNGEGQQLCHTLFNGKMKFPSLEKLYISNIGSVKLWESPARVMEEIYASTHEGLSQGRVPSDIFADLFSSFRNLRELYIDNCRALENLGPPSLAAALVHLEELHIIGCEMMVEVITMELEAGDYQYNEIPSKVITFPKLHVLKLVDLEIFKCFYAGSYELHFPALEVLALVGLPIMRTFVGSENCGALFSDKINFARALEIYLDINHPQYTDFQE